MLYINYISIKKSEFFFGLFAFSRATPAAYGGSQARGPIGAVAAGLHQSHSNVGSEPHLQLAPQLTAMPDLYPLSKVSDQIYVFMDTSRVC